MQEADHGGARRTIAVIGDFSGRERSTRTGSSPPLASRTPLPITKLDDCLRALRPRVHLDWDCAAALMLEFATLDDFLPSALLQRMPATRMPASADLVRRALHHPAVQSLEALWRGVALLVERLRPAGATVVLIDAAAPELERALSSGPDGSEDVARTLRAATAGHDDPFPAVIWLAEHVATVSQVRRLRAAAAVAAREGFVVITGAHPSLAALDATEPGPAGAAGRLWRELREAPESEHLQLVMPRFLVRAPYEAAHAHRADGWFDELPPGLDLASIHARLVWGNPALVSGIVLGRREPANLTVGGLTTFTIAGTGGVTFPVAESLLAEESALHLLRSGVTPLICHAGDGRGTVRLAALRSVSAWGAPLPVAAARTAI